MADQVIKLAVTRGEAELEEQRLRRQHEREVELFLVRLHAWAMVAAVLNTCVLAVVAWHYADTGNVAPGLGVFAAGATATYGGLYAARSGKVRGTRKAKSSETDN